MRKDEFIKIRIVGITLEKTSNQLLALIGHLNLSILTGQNKADGRKNEKTRHLDCTVKLVAMRK